MIHSQLSHLTQLSETSVFSFQRRIWGWPLTNYTTYIKVCLAHSKTEIKPQVLFTFAPGSPGIPLAPSAPGRPCKNPKEKTFESAMESVNI